MVIAAKRPYGGPHRTVEKQSDVSSAEARYLAQQQTAEVLRSVKSEVVWKGRSDKR